jgi:hypothetical protein
MSLLRGWLRASGAAERRTKFALWKEAKTAQDVNAQTKEEITEEPS